ncbi:MAG: hypothetical protein ACOY90_09860 [Candidatus Zhuqueibacterota bacterium]
MISSSILKSLWLLLVVLLIMLGNGMPLFCIVFLALIVLAAPLVREFSKSTNLDERQVQISHLSSHIAYFSYSTLVAFVLCYEWFVKAQGPVVEWFVLLFLPMVVKIIICLYQSYGFVSGLRGLIHLFFRGIIPSKQVDERQNLIGNFSSHIAFYVYTAMVVFYIIFKFIAVKTEPTTVWHFLLVVPLLVKFYSSFFMYYGAARGARYVCYFIAGIFLLFVMLSHGASLGALIEAAPFALMLGVAILSRRYPRIAGIVLIVLGVGSLILFSGWNRFDIYLRMTMYSLIPLPLFISGGGLLFVRRKLKEEE